MKDDKMVQRLAAEKELLHGRVESVMTRHHDLPPVRRLAGAEHMSRAERLGTEIELMRAWLGLFE